ncbi:MAG: helix-turn-helix transcriptional regulator [Victivallales bacterium]|nr:helix-turn-helix transcriptional regulator [Victivallales bacterium]
MTKLKQLRCKRKLKQKELAMIIGVKPASVCELEKKGVYNIKTAVKYARGLCCDPMLLLEIN